MIKKKFNNTKRKSRTFAIKQIAILTVQCTSNNTIIHAQCANQMNIVVSAGITGLKGAKRSTIYASQQTAIFMADKLKEKKIDSAIIIFKGFGRGRKSVIKGFKKKIKILQILDKTSIAHNGCRLPKKRRL